MISVLMPTFNGASFVAQAIGSVLAQEGVELELLVTDDGSSDSTPAIAHDIARRDERVRVAVQAPAGAAEARNASLARACGDWIALLDQDDLWPPGKLRRQLAVLDEDPAAAAVFGKTQLFGATTAATPEYTMLLAAGLLRRDAVDAFDPACGTADDLDFLLRMLEAGRRLELEPDIGVFHRRHPAQQSADLDATRRDCVAALGRSLRRRRATGQADPIRHPLVAGAGR